MVFYGRRSQGCPVCKTRKIKCDGKRPGCDRCVKSGYQCPGYFNWHKPVPTTQQQTTLMKAVGQEWKLPATTDKEVVKSLKNTCETIPSGISVPIEARASCYFVSNYILIPRLCSSTEGFLAFVLPLVREQAVPQLTYAFDACALASLSTRVGSGKRVDAMALARYTRALAATSKALQHPEVARLDATLAAVFLLGLFEHITAKHIMAWGMHIEGAVRLAGIRTNSDLQTKFGRGLRIAVQMQMITFMLSTGTAPSMDLQQCANEAVGNDYTLQCMGLSIRTASLSAEITRLLVRLSRSPANVKLIRDKIGQCQRLDREFVDWAHSLPSQFQCKVATWNCHRPPDPLYYEKLEVFPGRADIYSDLWVAYVWNMMRCSRVILASKVIRSAAWICSPMNYRTTPEYAVSSAICLTMIKGIIASVPYHLGGLLEDKKSLAEASRSGVGCGNECEEKSIAGFFLTSPLACVQGQDFTTNAQRAWAKGRLRHIATRLGVRSAGNLIPLNFRAPSMLIRRDRLMAELYNFLPDHEMPPSATGSPMPKHAPKSAVDQRTAIQIQLIEIRITKLVSEAMGDSGQVDEVSAKRWLQI